MMSVGLVAPAATRSATVVAAMICTWDVLMAMNVHIAFVAVSVVLFSDWSSLNALSPIGVAALPKPIMLAAMFRTMFPNAG